MSETGENKNNAAVSWQTQPMDKFYRMPNPNLGHYLRRQVKGDQHIIRTTFARGEDPSSVLSEWGGYLYPRLGSQYLFAGLHQFEVEQMGKVGPLSWQKPLSERLSSIEEYYTAVNLRADPVDTRAVAAAVNEFAHARGLRLRNVSGVVEDTKLSTNSGSPFFTKRSRVLGDTVPYRIERTNDGMWACHYPTGETYLLCATLGWRGQEGGPKPENVKQRVLWMFPMAANLEEFRVYQPLIAACQKYDLVAPWNGNEAVDAKITALFDSKSRNDLVVCTDFTGFDQHFNRALQDAALEFLSALFKGDRSFDDWSAQIYPIKYEIPLCIAEGRFAFGAHGMGSGSGGTNADETLAHRVLQHEAALRNGASLNPNSSVLGDDGIISYHGCNARQITEVYAQHGQVMKLEKQSESAEECVYLRRWHHRDYRDDANICVGVYPTMRALGRLMYMERYVDPRKWGPKAVAMRQLSIIENCAHHPEFDAFVEYCTTKDRYRLGIDLPNFLQNIDSEHREVMASGALDLSYTATFGNQKPPSAWSVTKILRSMVQR